jgi:serine phosphatase RsbU (regulator of sigma subunit)
VILDRRLELPALRRDGSEFPVELTVTRVPDVEPPLFAGFVRDLSEREQSERENTRLQERLAFLAHAGLALDVSLDFEETLRRLVALPVPDLAELAVIDLFGDDRSGRRVVTAAAVDPRMAEALERTRREQPLDLAGAHPVAQVLRSGESILLPDLSAELLEELAEGAEHHSLMTELRYRSAIVVPLPARSRLLGTLSLIRFDETVRYDGQDLLLGQTLARRAGLALENARLYESARRISRTLQQSLLPREMPVVPGARLVGRYRAAAEGQDVGGDFYDAFHIDDGRWGIAIGDVCGKGAEAAALTALARYTIRAVADRGPANVLSLLNDSVIRDQTEDRFLTAAFAEFSREGDDVVFEVAVAGHPAPLVVRAGGAVEAVDVHGPLVGVIPDIAVTPARIVLAPGDKLVLYTDGLTDARAPHVVLSEQDLAKLAAERHGLDAEQLAAFLEQSATAGAEPRDDIAIVVIEAVA